jgi:hypothetical protein
VYPRTSYTDLNGLLCKVITMSNHLLVSDHGSRVEPAT